MMTQVTQPLDLPNLVSGHIFSLLDFKSLKASREVCKSWYWFLEEDRPMWNSFIKCEWNFKWKYEESETQNYVEAKLLTWKALSNRIGQEESVAHIISLINLLQMFSKKCRQYVRKGNEGFLWQYTTFCCVWGPRDCAIKPWKFECVSQNQIRFEVFAFMEKLGIVTIEDINANPSYFLKWALVPGTKGDTILRYFLSRIRYDPKKCVQNGYKKILCSAISKNEVGKINLLCSEIGHDWKFWNSGCVETPLIDYSNT